jgi:hypothetical protein
LLKYHQLLSKKKNIIRIGAHVDLPDLHLTRRRHLQLATGIDGTKTTTGRRQPKHVTNNDGLA